MSGLLAGRTRALVLALLGVALLAVAPLILDEFTVYVLNRIVILGLFAVAFNIVFGYTGMASLGHAALFGAGSYVVAIGQTRYGWSAPVLLGLSVIVGALLGAVMGGLAVRTRGIYVLLLTLALAQAVWGLAFQQVEFTQGDNGITGVRPPMGLDRTAFYWFSLAIVVVCLAAMRLFVSSPVGRALEGIRHSESRMRALGYHVNQYRLVAFITSGAFSAVAGALNAWLAQSVNPEAVHWPLSAGVMTYAVLGGAASFFGPIVGAAVLVLLEVWVSSYTERWLVVLGLVYMLTVLFLPGGLTGLFARFRRRRKAEKVVPPAVLDEDPDAATLSFATDVIHGADLTGTSGTVSSGTGSADPGSSGASGAGSSGSVSAGGGGTDGAPSATGLSATAASRIPGDAHTPSSEEAR